MSLLTVRIPELQPKTPDLDLDLVDRMPIWISAENKTKYATLQQLYTFFQTGGGLSHPPVVNGAEVIYIVDAPNDGLDTAAIPSLAGLDFNLERGGIPLIPQLPISDPGYPDAAAEYEVLNAGGFKLLQPGDVQHLGERFKLELFTLVGGGGGGTPATPALITGAVDVTTNYPFDPVNDINKIIRFRATSSQVTLTLADIDDVPANTIIPIEALINNNKENKITTTGGQFIYFKNTSQNSVTIRPGEFLWLYRGTDGWYVIVAYGNWQDLANPFASYKIGLNQVICKGQTLLRADYPRLWEYVQTLGSSLTSDATWSTAAVYRQGNVYTLTPPGSGYYETIDKPYRGCFSTGDGSTTFRLPDLMNMALRGVKSEAGSDDDRYLNKPGGFQKDVVGPHSHNDVPLKVGDIDRGANGSLFSIDNNGKTANAGDGIWSETTMKNIGVLWAINV